MKILRTMIIAGLFTASAMGQTNAGAQASGAASSNTSVNADKHSANVQSDTSANADAKAAAAHKGHSDAGASKSNASASAKGQQSASGNASAGDGSLALSGDSAVQAVLSKSIATGKNKPGDQVVAKTTSDLKQDGKVIVPKGSRLIGHVTESRAKAKGESQSSLGMMFDTIETKDGRRIPIQGTLQAVAAPAVSAMADNDDLFAAGSAMGSASGRGVVSAPARSGGGSGLLGGGGGAVGGVVNTATSAASGVGSTAGGAVNTATGAAGRAAGGLGQTTANATGALSSSSTGAMNMKGVQLVSSASGQGSAAGSVLTSANKNIQLQSGSQMVVNLAAAASRNEKQ